MERVAIYLRKSRADMDAEARGEGETLEKHRKILEELATENGYNIVKIYEEIASGEYIAHRPAMMELLKNVKLGLYDAVLVVDIDRLGRGNMQDQGLILDTFKESKTKIITPRKVYDLDNEFDEEYSEFEAFLARKEFKLIRRRMERGVIRAIKDGYYIGSWRPYGYRKVKKNGVSTLEPDPHEAEIVKKIFEWYTSKDPKIRIGSTNICKKLNDLGVPSYHGTQWNNQVVLSILKNPIYLGKITWRKTEQTKTYDKYGRKTRKTRFRKDDEIMLVDGRHPPLVSQEMFDEAQMLRKTRSHPGLSKKRPLQNPLAGLLICGFCGGHISVFRAGRKKRYQYIRCGRKGHGGGCNKITRLEHVEKKVIEKLREWLKKYDEELRIKDNEIKQEDQNLEFYTVTINTLEVELKKLQSQKDKLHDLLEQGIYDKETFLERFAKIKKKIQETEVKLRQTTEDYEAEREKIEKRNTIIPEAKKVIDIYEDLTTPYEKNLLLREIVNKIVYKKEKHQRGAEFFIEIHTKI